jgi:hypothetical protein
MKTLAVFVACAVVALSAQKANSDDPCIPYTDPVCGEATDNYWCPLSDFGGVVAFSNGAWTGNGNCGEFQCVQFVRRVYRDEIDNTLGPLGDNSWAVEAFDAWSGNSGLEQYVDGQSTAPPEPGDIFCQSGNTFGHIAIIKSVDLSTRQVVIVDQNRDQYQAEMTLALDVDEQGRYSIDPIGGSFTTLGWLRDPDYAATLYQTSVVSQSPTGPTSVAVRELAYFRVQFRNEGTTPWYNDPVAHPNAYVELKACDADGVTLSDGSSPLRYDRTWLNPESPCTMLETEVPPGETATFLFTGEVSDEFGNGLILAYFRPNHATAGLIPGWSGMHFQLDVRTGWLATLPMNDCIGPADDSMRQWFQTDFVATANEWVSVAIPNTNWDCNTCDRFYRLWYDFAGTQNGYGEYIHFISDDAISIWINGVPVGSWGAGCHGSGCVNGSGGCNPNFLAPDIDITSYLHEGKNLIAAHVSEHSGGESFDMQFFSQPQQITDNAICCLGDEQCQEITESYPSSTCIAEGGTVYVGGWFDCETFSPCLNAQTKGRGDPTLFFQTSVPLPTAPAQVTFDLIDTVPRSAWYDLPEVLGGQRLYVSDFVGSFAIAAAPSTDADTLNITVTEYYIECPSVNIGLIPTGTNLVRLDTSVAVGSSGTYCVSSGMVDVIVQTVIINDLYPESSPIRSRSEIRGNLDGESGVLVVGSESYNVLPGPVLVPGDMNASGTCNLTDVTYLVNYMFLSGPEPIPVKLAGDVNCDGVISLTDLTRLVNYLFLNGPPLCSHF